MIEFFDLLLSSIINYLSIYERLITIILRYYTFIK